jgi:thiol-disulfide isomerase/thioredoxin
MELREVIPTRFSACLLAAALSAAPLAAKLRAGHAAPDFILPRLGKGDKVQLNSLAGKVVFIDFWASWCPPCRKSLPEIARMRARHPGLVVLAVSEDEDGAKALQFLKDEETDLLALHDARQKVADAYGLEGMPTGFLVDRKGVVRYRHDGYDDGDFAALDEEAGKLMEEKP